MNLYLEAAEILESDQKTSLKSIIYNGSKGRSTAPAKLYALVSETIKFQDILQDVITRSGILNAERKVSLSSDQFVHASGAGLPHQFSPSLLLPPLHASFFLHRVRVQCLRQ